LTNWRENNLVLIVFCCIFVFDFLLKECSLTYCWKGFRHRNGRIKNLLSTFLEIAPQIAPLYKNTVKEKPRKRFVLGRLKE